MEKIVKLIKILIKEYNETNDEITKKGIVHDIYYLYLRIEGLQSGSLFRVLCNKISFYDYSYISSILNKIINLLQQQMNLDNKFKTLFENVQSNSKLYSNTYTFNDDVKFLKYILKDINFNNSINYVGNNNEKILDDYIRSDEEFFSFVKTAKKESIYDYRFQSSCYLNIITRNVYIFDIKDIYKQIHEYMHGFVKDGENKYLETCSILSEIGLRKNDVNGALFRMNNINILKNYINLVKNYRDIFYGVGSLISISFIYKYGSDFKTIMEAIKLILSNDDLMYEDMFKKLNIGRKDAMNSVKALLNKKG